MVNCWQKSHQYLDNKLIDVKAYSHRARAGAETASLAVSLGMGHRPIWFFATCDAAPALAWSEWHRYYLMGPICKRQRSRSVWIGPNSFGKNILGFGFCSFEENTGCGRIRNGERIVDYHCVIICSLTQPSFRLALPSVACNIDLTYL